MTNSWPTTPELTKAVLKTLVSLGGTANVSEIDKGVLKEINLTQEMLELKHSGNRSEIKYRLAWVRTKAKQNGLVTKELNRNWTITEKGKSLI